MTCAPLVCREMTTGPEAAAPLVEDPWGGEEEGVAQAAESAKVVAGGPTTHSARDGRCAHIGRDGSGIK